MQIFRLAASTAGTYEREFGKTEAPGNEVLLSEVLLRHVYHNYSIEVCLIITGALHIASFHRQQKSLAN